MEMLFKVLFWGIIAIVGMMLIRVFKGPGVFDRLNGIFAIGIDVIVILLLVGFAGGRQDMYVDIALSYGILGFLSTVIIARYLGARIDPSDRKDEEEVILDLAAIDARERAEAEASGTGKGGEESE